MRGNASSSTAQVENKILSKNFTTKTSKCDTGVENRKEVSLERYRVEIEVTRFEIISMMKIARKPSDIILLIRR